MQGEVKSAKANLIWIRNELRNGIIDTYIGDIVLKINKEEALWYYVKSVKEDKNYKILYRSFFYILLQYHKILVIWKKHYYFIIILRN